MIVTDEKTSVYEKWMKRDGGSKGYLAFENVVVGRFSGHSLYYTGTDDVEIPTLFTISDEANGRLPDHHPVLLIQYLIWGMYFITI